MSTLNPFATLGLSPGATETDIKKSFRKLALVWHPDKNPHRKDEATKKFQDINDAYNVLNDAKTRREAEIKWRTSSKTTSAHYSYGSTPTSSSRGGGWTSTHHTWDDPFPEYGGATGWSYQGFYAGYARPQQQQQQSRSSAKPSRSKSSAYNYYAQKDNTNRYAYDSTPSGSNKFRSKTKPRPKTETKPKPEPRAETKPKPTPRQETKPKPEPRRSSQFEDAYSTPPQFKSTAGDPNFTRKTGYSYTSGERYRPGDTPNVKPPVYDNQEEKEKEHDNSGTGVPFNYERQRAPHSSAGKGEKFKMYDEPPPKNKPTSGSFNFTMPDMKTSEPSPANKSFREDHSFVFGEEDEESEDDGDFSDADLPDPHYKPTKNPFGFNSDFVDLTGTDDEVEELSPGEYREIAKEAQRRKDQERREELINEAKAKSQRAQAMFGDMSSSSDDYDEDLHGHHESSSSSDSDEEDARMFEAQDDGLGSQGSFFGSGIFNSMPFEKDVLSSMFDFSIGSNDSPRAKTPRRPMSSHRRRKPQPTTSQTYARTRQPYMEQDTEPPTTSRSPFTPRPPGRAPPAKKVSPDYKQTPLFDINNIHPFNETNGNFGMDEIRNNIDQMGGDKVKTEKGRPIGEDSNGNSSSGRFARSKNTTSEPVNTSTSSAFRTPGASSYTKLNIDLGTDKSQLIQAPTPPAITYNSGDDKDAALARYLREFQQYENDMEVFYQLCIEYRASRVQATATHKNVLNSSSTYRKANIEAREVDALMVEKEYSATRKHIEALEHYDAIINQLR
ncbi:DnaJ-like protein subfamily B member 8 [Yarrowia sp. C11]|nr:DnaJ-like protein subfamily B member 8 [Yarrowia sp. C11]KAG5364185.1 DnaJ-like protein subfamily B member 8 [Yarrowia sp. E02]